MDLLNIEPLQALLRQFSADRDWEQFHDPKNLAMALAGEAGELASVLQWVTGAESAQRVGPSGDLRAEFAGEVADVMIYLARLADVADLPLAEAVAEKMDLNATRFPPGSRS